MDDHTKYLLAAYVISTQSEDPSTQTGAVIVRDRKIISVGYNHLPKGTDPAVWHDKKKKYELVTHAEVAAIENADDVKGATLYTPWNPCTPCCNRIITSGLDGIVTHKGMNDMTPERWADSIKESLDLLAEHGIEYNEVDEVLGGPQVRFSEKYWRP